MPKPGVCWKGFWGGATETGGPFGRLFDCAGWLTLFRMTGAAYRLSLGAIREA